MMAAPTTWLNRRERGTVALMRAAFALATLLGRRPMRPLVLLVALWYRLCDRGALRVSRAWFTRLHGRPPGFRETYGHFRAFTQVTLDRLFLLQGRTRGLRITRTGSEHLARQHASGRGAVLLGAHLGSFEALRAAGAAHELPLRIVGHFENARMINGLLERVNPGMAARVIHVGGDPVGVMAELREQVEQGAFVGLLADRVGLNDRVVHAPFLGAEAPFAAGPFLLASLLRCPVYLVLGLYRDPASYDLHCEPFAECIELPRAGREAQLRRWVELYAQRLEVYCRKAPDNWFNWFDFWSRP